MLSTHSPDPGLLSGRDWRAALEFVSDMVDALHDGDGFARCGVELLPKLVDSDLTTLSLCDLRTGRRHVVASPGGSLGAEARTAFDRHFHQHPLVRHHAYERGEHTHRISDSLPFAAFRQTSLYDEYYRRIGIDHVMALPVMVDDNWLVSFVLNRRGRDFSDAEAARLDQVRASIGRLFRRTRLLQRARESWCDSTPRPRAPTLPALPGLSTREHEVLAWVAAGKTDRSEKTVRNQLTRVYAKLGVETRTAAVMRALARG